MGSEMCIRDRPSKGAVRPAQVKDVLIEHDVHVLEYHEEAEAVEFEASERQRTTRVQTDAGDI